jgi:putative DNA primase/helicase
MTIHEPQTDFKVPVNLTAEQDEQLIRNGYEPLPVIEKRPVVKGWREGKITAERIAAERAAFPDATSTGLRTGELIVDDIDLVDEGDAAVHIKLAQDMLGDTPLVRHGSKGAALCYQTETPSSKIIINTSKPNPTGKGTQKIEILGSGQQFVAFGIHPDTGQPYEWIGNGTPLDVLFLELPEVTPAQLRAYAHAAKELLEAQGYGPVTISGDTSEQRKEPSATTGARVTWEGLAERLSYIHPQFDGARPDCYPQPNTRKLPYGPDTWLGIALCLRDGNIPWLGEEPTREQRLELIEKWSSGDLWCDRTDKGINVTTFPEQGIEARLGGKASKHGNVTTIATIIKYAADAGCPLPSDDEPKPLASDTFAKFAAVAQIAANAGATLGSNDGYTNSGGLSFRSMQDIKPVEIDWLWPERIAAGKLTLIAGAPDGGKSQIAANIAATISNGGAWPFGEGSAEQGAVIWLSAEDDPADTTVPRLIAASANRRLIFELKPVVRVEGGLRTLNVVEDLGEIARVIEKIKTDYGVPVKAIVIDPISAYMGGRSQGDTWKNSDVRHTMTPLLEFVGRVGISTLGITHFKKGRDADVLNRVIDSIALPALSRATWLVAPEKDDEGNPTGRRLFLVGKKNIGRPVAGLAYKIVEKLIDNGRGGTMPAPCVEWAGYVAATADDALAEQTGKAGKLEAAEDFLMRILGDGPVTEKEIRKRAGEKHRWRTLQRAKEKLGIISERAGGLAGSGEWQWVLPRTEHVEDGDPDAAL